MAWLPLHDGFLLDSHHTIAWQWPAVEGTPWKNAMKIGSGTVPDAPV